MRRSITFFMFVLLIQACASNQSIFELGPSQSMSISGKGEGQDAAINPFSQTKSIAIVNNLGKTPFYIRVQKNGSIIQEVEVNPKQSKEVILQKGYELYFDSVLASKAQVTFKKG